MGTLSARLGVVNVGDNDRVAIMGVINLDPNSFFMGSFHATPKNAVSSAIKMIGERVDIIDVGGASSAPGAPPVSVATEKKRIVKIIRRLAKDFDITISIDTQHASVAQLALEEGATIVNDVSGLKRDPAMASVIKDSGASCVLMASKQRPGDCETIPHILSALKESLQIASETGISRRQIVVDPGIGFGKPVDCDLQIITNLTALREVNQPVLIGASRKNFVGEVLGYPLPKDRLYGSLAAVAVALREGVHVIRTHDVVPTQDCVKMVQALYSVRGCD
ncbi:MAG: dihydropteroate synthase [Candidatus Hodarchaeota archaeon]